jgi:hypothetical protein
MTANHAWEQVLATVEADAARAEQLLRPTLAASAAESATPEPAAWLVPAEVLPPLHEMPPVPDEVRCHVESLRDRIDALRAELADVLRDWPHPTSLVPVVTSLVGSSAAAAARSRLEHAVYVDRRL